MTTFLSWLWNKAIYVYDWFSVNYPTFVNVVRNTWSWILSKASETYNNAITWAWGQIQDVKQYLIGLLELVNSRINGIRSNISILVDNYLKEWKNDVWGLLDWLKDKVTSFSTTIEWLKTNVSDVVKNFVIGFINGAIGTIANNYGWLLNIKSFLLSLTNSVNDNDVANLNTLLRQYYKDIKEFFDNPLGYMLDLFFSKALEFAKWVIAIGLGSTKYDLPKPPTWRKIK